MAAEEPPASVPFWSALLLGLDFTALTWLIWLELLPRGLLLTLELPRDKDYRGMPPGPPGTRLWIALLSRMTALEDFGLRFFASLAAFVYCFLPFVIVEERRFAAGSPLLASPLSRSPLPGADSRIPYPSRDG